MIIAKIIFVQQYNDKTTSLYYFVTFWGFLYQLCLVPFFFMYQMIMTKLTYGSYNLYHHLNSFVFVSHECLVWWEMYSGLYFVF